MSMLVDYVCTSCRHREEYWVPSPPPASASCRSCGNQARRAFSAIGLSGSRSSQEDAKPSTDGLARKNVSLCRQYPQIPGLCHMSESAQRRWVATYLRDNRVLEREIARQEQAAKEKTPVMADAITHHHHSGHGGGPRSQTAPSGPPSP